MKRFILLILYTLSKLTLSIEDSIFDKLDYLQLSANYSLNYAYAAYDTNKTEIESFKHWECQCCVPHQKLLNLTVIETEANLAYVGYNSIKKQIFVVFRGTFNACGWFCTDFDVAFTEYKNHTGHTIGKVHAGFYDRWKTDLADKVTTRVIDLIDEYYGNDSCSIMATGHSLGASISQIAAISFADNIDIDCDIYNINFGSPYWADSDMIDHYQQQLGNNSWRVVHRYDPVPWVKANHEYKHTPIFIHYDSSNKCSLHNVICKQDDNSDQCSYGLSELCIYDHSHYIGAHSESCNKCSDYDCGPFSHDDFEVDIDETSTLEEIGAVWEKICDKILRCKDDDADIAIRYQCSISLIIVLFLCFIML
eukprot:111602_1